MYGKHNKARRNKLIAEDYTRLFFEECKRDEAIFVELGEKYFLEPDTIYRIILEQQRKADKMQNKLDLK